MACPKKRGDMTEPYNGDKSGNPFFHGKGAIDPSFYACGVSLPDPLPAPLVSVCIPVGPNRERNLNLCLAALSKQTFKDFEVVLASDDFDSIEQPSGGWCGPLRMQLAVQINQEPNLGAVNRNTAARYAKGDFLLFVDSDIVLPPWAIARYLDDFRQFPRRVIAGPYHWLPPMHIDTSALDAWEDFEFRCHDAILNFKRNKRTFHNVRLENRPVFAGDTKQDELFCEYPLCLSLYSGNLAVSRKTFEEVGGFWEGISHGIDGCFGMDVVRSGHVFSFEPRVEGYHLYHKRTGVVKDPIHDKIMARYHSDDSWLGQRAWP